MNLAEGLAVFVPGVVSGALLFVLLWDEGTEAFLLTVCLGAGAGLGISSLLYYLYMLAFAGAHFFIYIQLVILLALIGLTLRHGKIHPHMALPQGRLGAWQILLMGCFLLVLAFAVLSASQIWTHDINGGWDASAIYNRTARFIFRGQVAWMQAFSPGIWPGFHADYPLLLPLNVAQGWDLLGRESQSAPRVLSGIFMVACAGVFFAAIAWIKNIWQAIIALVLLLNSQLFIRNGMAQTADIPLSLYILSTVVTICLYTLHQKSGLLVMAGLTAGLAAWTKNEGTLFVIAVAAGLCVAFYRQDLWRRMGLFAAGLGFPLSIVLGFKLFIAPPNDLLGTDSSGLLQNILELPRHIAIGSSVATELFGVGGLISLLPLLGLGALVLGIAPQKRLQSAYLTILVAAGIQVVGYYGIYLITPHSIQWQLDSSLDRVLFHISLPLLFLFFIIVGDVQKALRFEQSAPEESPASI
jgi:dolichyl-phosphate-mannose-protein mannosyltransferase